MNADVSWPETHIHSCEHVASIRCNVCSFLPEIYFIAYVNIVLIETDIGKDM